jgi:hypothetical protein
MISTPQQAEPSTDPVGPAEERPGGRGWLGGVVKAAVSIALLALLLSRVDLARLWQTAREASFGWLGVALLLYTAMAALSAWRWGVLLRAQRVHVPAWTLFRSFVVATFFNNFLPSNIGGDVVRVADTAGAAGSKTLATTVILIDRGLGLLALVGIAAVAASWTALGNARLAGPLSAPLLWLAFLGGAGGALLAILAPAAFTALFSPLRRLHADWVDHRLGLVTTALHRFREDPAALASGALGAVAVQLVLVAFYLAVARSLLVPIGPGPLAVIVPMSFLVQMLPISMNGLGVREATFGYYFTRLGLTLESALLVSFLGAALIMLFSLVGGALYLFRRPVAANAGARE